MFRMAFSIILRTLGFTGQQWVLLYVLNRLQLCGDSAAKHLMNINITKKTMKSDGLAEYFDAVT